jgi:HEPN domain-containing protein
MSKYKFVRDYLDEAKFRIEVAEIALNKERFNSVIRETQIIVELTGKALIARWNMEIPKSHNIYQDIEDIKELYSEKFQKNIKEIINILKKIRREYEISLYGDYEENISLSELYTQDEAEKFLSNAKKFHNMCIEELKDFLNKKE